MKIAKAFTENFPIYPPFNGFPKEGLKFLRELKKNNNREWFNAHKSEYEEFVKLPMQSLIFEIKPYIQEFAPNFIIDPNSSIFRIYRDVRFSKDKSPYKTHISAIFHPSKNWKDSASLYIEIAPGGIFLGGGLYMPSSLHQKKFRSFLIENSDNFLKIIKANDFKKYFSDVQGDKLSRVPSGFPKDHALSEYLKLKQFYIGIDLPESDCLDKSFVMKVVNIFSKMMPFVNFINNSIR